MYLANDLLAEWINFTFTPGGVNAVNAESSRPDYATVRRCELQGKMGGSIIREILLTASEFQVKLLPDSEMNVTHRLANGL